MIKGGLNNRDAGRHQCMTREKLDMQTLAKSYTCWIWSSIVAKGGFDCFMLDNSGDFVTIRHATLGNATHGATLGKNTQNN